MLTLVLAIGAGLYGCEAAKNWAMWGIVCAPNYQKTLLPADDPGVGELRSLGVDRQLRIEVGPPPASLSAWIIERKTDEASSAQESRGTILMLHGIHGNKRHMLGMSDTLAMHGFRCVLVDLRGHGRSSGDWFTYGVQESKDLSQVLEKWFASCPWASRKNPARFVGAVS
ncbi:MAG TPA: alpha/beta fold hydrolase [Phycisphaerae bacterium]|nr:alpha/beta fold hydrolase [Phycisphaerae bacterium]